MLNTEELKAVIAQLPLVEREELQTILEQSIAADHCRLADEEVQRHLETCRDRLARYDAGEMSGIPFDKAINGVFGSE